MFKVNSRNTRTRCETFLKLTIKDQNDAWQEKMMVIPCVKIFKKTTE